MNSWKPLSRASPVATTKAIILLVARTLERILLRGCLLFIITLVEEVLGFGEEILPSRFQKSPCLLCLGLAVVRQIPTLILLMGGHPLRIHEIASLFGTTSDVLTGHVGLFL